MQANASFLYLWTINDSNYLRFRSYLSILHFLFVSSVHDQLITHVTCHPLLPAVVQSSITADSPVGSFDRQMNAEPDGRVKWS